MIMLRPFTKSQRKPQRGWEPSRDTQQVTESLKGVLNLFKRTLLEIKVSLIEEGHGSQPSVSLDGVDLLFSQFCLIFYISIIQLLAYKPSPSFLFSRFQGELRCSDTSPSMQSLQVSSIAINLQIRFICCTQIRLIHFKPFFPRHFEIGISISQGSWLDLHQASLTKAILVSRQPRKHWVSCAFVTMVSCRQIKYHIQQQPLVQEKRVA